MKLENQMVILMVFSVLAVGLYHFVPREHRINPASDQWVASSGSGVDGREMQLDITAQGYEVDFDILADADYKAFPALQFFPAAESKAADLSWMESLELRARVEGRESCYFRFHVRNHIPKVIVGKENQTPKYNEVSFKIGNEAQTLVLDREHFQVPVWWVERWNIPYDRSHPSFDDIQLLTIIAVSGNECPEFKLIVEEVVFQGHWIPTDVLYRTLSLLWLVFAVGVAINKSLDIHQRYRSTKEREVQLVSLNNTLSRKADELSVVARVDPLTGLLNRYGVRDYVEVATDLAANQKVPVSIVILDIDHFKILNDTYGHNYGDEVLRKMGEVLISNVSEEVVVARWGGEEFLAICQNCDSQQAMQWANTLRQEIEEKVEVTCSFGVYQLKPAEAFIEAVAKADTALYRSKTGGRNRVTVFDASLPKQSNASVIVTTDSTATEIPPSSLIS